MESSSARLKGTGTRQPKGRKEGKGTADIERKEAALRSTYSHQQNQKEEQGGS